MRSPQRSRTERTPSHWELGGAVRATYHESKGYTRCVTRPYSLRGKESHIIKWSENLRHPVHQMLIVFPLECWTISVVFIIVYQVTDYTR
jgi:hypothetical protein